MYKGNKILAVIPARGGSKGIKNKNIVNIEGHPLIEFTIREAIKSIYIDRLIVSTDSEKICKIAKQFNADVPFLRDKKFSTDQSKTIDVLVNLVENLKKSKQNYDYLILLQPTQPLRKVNHIDEAIEIIIDNQFDSLLSVNLVDDHPILIRTINGKGRLENILGIKSTLRRQDFPNYYKVNGAIYINKINDEFDETVSLNDNSYPYIMDKKYDLDIDEPFDLELLKIRLKWLEKQSI